MPIIVKNRMNTIRIHEIDFELGEIEIRVFDAIMLNLNEEGNNGFGKFKLTSKNDKAMIFFVD